MVKSVSWPMAEMMGISEMEDGFGEEFGIEGGEIFERAAAARDDDDIHGAGAIEIRDAGGDFSSGGFALHQRRVEQDVQAGVAAADDVDEVANDGAGGRGDDADAVRECGERLFAGGIEEAARFKALPELLEGDLQRAGADGFEEFRNELHLSALLVDGDFAAEQHMQAVGWFEAEQRGLLAEQDRRQLRLAIFEREVDVAGGRGAQVGDFAFDPEVAVLALDMQADFADKVADLPDLARNGHRGRLERQAELALGPLLGAGQGVHHC